MRGVLTSGAQVEVLTAAAGTGKSFVVGAIADTWTSQHDPDVEPGRVFGLASRSPRPRRGSLHRISHRFTGRLTPTVQAGVADLIPADLGPGEAGPAAPPVVARPGRGRRHPPPRTRRRDRAGVPRGGRSSRSARFPTPARSSPARTGSTAPAGPPPTANSPTTPTSTTRSATPRAAAGSSTGCCFAPPTTPCSSRTPARKRPG